MSSSKDCGSFGKKDPSPDFISTRSFSDENNFQLSSNEKIYSEQKPKRNRLIHRFTDSFKRAEGSTTKIKPINENTSDLEDGIQSFTSDSKLKKSMKSRHVVMMSLGTGIGTGLLVANAKGLHYGGPAALVIGYVLVSFITYFMIQAAGEMAVTYPTLPANFNAYSSIFISKPFGFATVSVSYTHLDVYKRQLYMVI